MWESPTLPQACLDKDISFLSRRKSDIGLSLFLIHSQPELQAPGVIGRKAGLARADPWLRTVLGPDFVPILL